MPSRFVQVIKCRSLVLEVPVQVLGKLLGNKCEQQAELVKAGAIAGLVKMMGHSGSNAQVLC